MLKTTIRNIYTVICCLVIALVLALGVAVIAGYQPKVLLSESMEPEVIRGSLVFVDTNATLDQIMVGDNVVFDLDGVQILHKVRAVHTDDGVVESVVVSGLGSSDETLVDSSTFIGRQGATFPRLGKYFYWVEKDGMWAGISVACVLILIGCVPWNRKKK
ncbi:MAG: signal peptidase I [Clostridia bacterium]|nr:signal peptidase I [Clostridia bacterium]